jgi:hypothetical protein
MLDLENDNKHNPHREITSLTNNNDIKILTVLEQIYGLLKSMKEDLNSKDLPDDTVNEELYKISVDGPYYLCSLSGKEDRCTLLRFKTDYNKLYFNSNLNKEGVKNSDDPEIANAIACLYNVEVNSSYELLNGRSDENDDIQLMQFDTYEQAVSALDFNKMNPEIVHIMPTQIATFTEHNGTYAGVSGIDVIFNLETYITK